MSVNSSSSSSSLTANSSSINYYIFLLKCYDTTVGIFNISAFIVTLLLLILPPCVFVIYLGFQRWRQQRSGTTMSHSDVVTFHMVAMELMSIVGSIINCCGILTRLLEVMIVGLNLITINMSGQLSFHTLTCVERYLAVVHPVTYLGLKKGKGIRLRNISIGCVWLMAFSNIGPGAGGEGRPRVDQSKMRAFYTIMAILEALFIRVGATVVTAALFTSPHFKLVHIQFKPVHIQFKLVIIHFKLVIIQFKLVIIQFKPVHIQFKPVIIQFKLVHIQFKLVHIQFKPVHIQFKPVIIQFKLVIIQFKLVHIQFKPYADTRAFSLQTAAADQNLWLVKSRIYDFIQKCYNTSAGTYNVTVYTVTLLLLVLPLCVYVIYLGFQRWRQQRSGTTMSHSDVVTFHMVAVELMNIVGSILFCCGVYTRSYVGMMMGTSLLTINISGQLLFHTLTCVERYLAVVHPVTYLGLKKGKGIRLRNISIGLLWGGNLRVTATNPVTLEPNVEPLGLKKQMEREEQQPEEPFIGWRQMLGSPCPVAGSRFLVSRLRIQFPVSRLRIQFRVSRLRIQFPVSRLRIQFPVSRLRIQFPVSRLRIRIQFPVSRRRLQVPRVPSPDPDPVPRDPSPDPDPVPRDPSAAEITHVTK
ncbi:hypothetical protein EYF80_051685 [Liparis tanakae]|uniref:G-protein coupled receptors family 1 profile domain-containing protein n=1 Tax=Liparis tanakae TaxID=230148 RepID=A0A4Z2FAH6_9TELE|nr:hypothetical protein EYF80_051685 [Liparis tanakae]